MRRFVLNFHKSTRERAAELSARTYNYYRRLQPIVGKVYNPIKELHNKYAPWKKYSK